MILKSFLLCACVTCVVTIQTCLSPHIVWKVSLENLNHHIVIKWIRFLWRFKVWLSLQETNMSQGSLLWCDRTTILHVCVCVCVLSCILCSLCHSFSAFVCSEPIHLLTLVSPASCMTIRAIKLRVEHTLFNSYHKNNKSKEDECLPSQGMKRGGEERRRRRRKRLWARLVTLTPYHMRQKDTKPQKTYTLKSYTAILVSARHFH